MNRKIFNAKRLAELGKQWFAKPPATHQCPGEAMRSCAVFMAAPGGKGSLNEFVVSQGHSLETYTDLTYLGAAAVVAGQWLVKNGPTIFVQAETAYLAGLTDALQGVQANDLKLALPHVYFCVPKDRAIEFNGARYCDCIATLSTSATKHFTKDGWIDVPASPHLTICWYGEKVSDEPVYILFPVQTGLTIQAEISKIFDCTGGNSFRPFSISKEKYTEFAGMVVNFLLLMQSYPKYLERLTGHDRQFRRKIAGQESADCPSFVLSTSRKRNLLQIVQRMMQAEADGTHASPDMHWRRGHWRRQRHGDRWELSNPEGQVLFFPDGVRFHMRWLLPMFVGALGIEDNEGVVQEETSIL